MPLHVDAKGNIDPDLLISKTRPQDLVRPVQRAWLQDDTMDFYDEADELPVGGIRLKPSDAPMVAGKTLVPVKALELEGPARCPVDSEQVVGILLEGIQERVWLGLAVSFSLHLPHRALHPVASRHHRLFLK
jgi:hypothetical protein